MTDPTEPVPDSFDDYLRRAARAARAEIEHGVDAVGDRNAIARRSAPDLAAPVRSSSHRRRWAVAGAAAATVAIVVGATVLVDRGDDGSLATTEAPTTAMTTIATTNPPASTTTAPPARVTAPSSISFEADGRGFEPAPIPDNSLISCATGDPDGTVERIRVDVISARDPRFSRDDNPGRRIAPCIDEVPDVFTGTVPACWTQCDGFEGVIRSSAVSEWFGGLPGAMGEGRSFTLFHTLRRGDEIVDVAEGWSFRLTDDGIALDAITFGEPLSTRAEAVETLDMYLGHLRSGDWLAAAAMHDDGAVNPNERSDLARLDLGGDYSIESIATALEAWCDSRCITETPNRTELVWDGWFYGFERFGETVRVAWFEGMRSIVGLPPRVPPERTNIPEVSWRDLPWEATRIDRSCDDLGCRPWVDVIGDGTTFIVGDDTLRRLDRPSIEVGVPGLNYVVALGSDDVVYVTVGGDENASADVVAISLAPDDAGRVIDRWPEVHGAHGDSELVAMRDGLVVVGCCGPDTVRPAPDAPIVVPWVDRTGAPVSSIQPTVQVEIDHPWLTVTRTDDGATRTWEVDLGDDWRPRGMPRFMPTFDGGVLLATYGADGVTITRTWRTGDIDRVRMVDAIDVTLDPSGRIVVPDGERFARVDPFPGRTPIWDGRPEIDLATGSVTLPGIAEWSAGQDWVFDPVALADVVAGPPAVNERRTIELDRVGADTFVVTATTSNFFDDSVFADRYELTLTRDAAGRFQVDDARWTNACQPNRGHQDFSIELCT